MLCTQTIGLDLGARKHQHGGFLAPHRWLVLCQHVLVKLTHLGVIQRLHVLLGAEESQRFIQGEGRNDLGMGFFYPFMSGYHLCTFLVPDELADLLACRLFDPLSKTSCDTDRVKGVRRTGQRTIP